VIDIIVWTIANVETGYCYTQKHAQGVPEAVFTLRSQVRGPVQFAHHAFLSKFRTVSQRTVPSSGTGRQLPPLRYLCSYELLNAALDKQCGHCPQ
jgi:hypothetical protein